MMGLQSYVGLALLSLSGVAIHAARVPERMLPGRFDFLGNSHNLMHVLTVFGAWVRFKGLKVAATNWNAGSFEKVCSGVY